MLGVVSISKAEAEERADFARDIRDIADRYERGDISELAIVGNDRADGCFMSVGRFDDRWRMLGAIEYAKMSALNN